MAIRKKDFDGQTLSPELAAEISSKLRTESASKRLRLLNYFSKFFDDNSIPMDTQLKILESADKKIKNNQG